MGAANIAAGNVAARLPPTMMALQEALFVALRSEGRVPQFPVDASVGGFCVGGAMTVNHTDIYLFHTGNVR